MLGIPLAFWLVAFAFFVVGRRRRRWERWARRDPRYFGHGPWGPPQSAEVSTPELSLIHI